MNSKWIYILAVLLLPLLRVLVIDIQIDEWLMSQHFYSVAYGIAVLRDSPAFIEYIGNWALPVFVGATFFFWVTERGDADISKHFLLLPIAYVPFNIVGTVLKTAEFHFSYLYVQPLVILTFGYIYVSLWAVLVWLLGKLHIVD